jgi:hypothetical protein
MNDVLTGTIFKIIGGLLFVFCIVCVIIKKPEDFIMGRGKQE